MFGPLESKLLFKYVNGRVIICGLIHFLVGKTVLCVYVCNSPSLPPNVTQ